MLQVCVVSWMWMRQYCFEERLMLCPHEHCEVTEEQNWLMLLMLMVLLLLLMIKLKVKTSMMMTMRRRRMVIGQGYWKSIAFRRLAYQLACRQRLWVPQVMLQQLIVQPNFAGSMHLVCFE